MDDSKMDDNKMDDNKMDENTNDNYKNDNNMKDDMKDEGNKDEDNKNEDNKNKDNKNKDNKNDDKNDDMKDDKMDDSTTPTASIQSKKDSKKTNKRSITLRLAGESFCVPRWLIWKPCRYIQDNAKRVDDDGPWAPLDLPWEDVVTPETLTLFIELLSVSDPSGLGRDFNSNIDIYGPDESRIECLTALARLEKLAALLGCSGVDKAVRRAGIKIVRQVHAPQDTDADLKQSVQQFDAAYRAWSDTDTLIQQWILIKFYKLVDVDHAMSLEPDVSDQFREKALAHCQASVHRKAAASGGGDKGSTEETAD
ncbi:hypothetical protein PG988_001331 [Apiospora saccharicola]